jgi:hypothetical protein
MEAPLLFALARARLNAGGGAIQAAWASRRALGLAWAPDKRADIEPGSAWIFLLSPEPELWKLHEKSEAYSLLKAESNSSLSRKWSVELKAARLCDVIGDPRERWIAFEFRRRAITGQIESLRLAFQAIPGRGGIRLDEPGQGQALVGMGTIFSKDQPEPAPDTPPLKRWRERWGDRLEAALQGQMDDVLEGEGPLLQRHEEWALKRAQKLLLQPREQAELRMRDRERQRLERYGQALEQDRARHQAMALLAEPAQKLQSELWRLKGATGGAEFLDGTSVELPPGQRAEETVQKWFGAAKKAKRGLERVAALEQERQRQLKELQAACGAKTAAAQGPAPAKKTKGAGEKTKNEKLDKRADGKGRAFRSLLVDGFEVLIGKGDADNDSLTFKVAAPLDYWLHAASAAGSHVVIRNPDKLKDIPKSVLERAAELAAFYSKARDGGKTEVHWCRVSDVNKPRGFAPGKVMLKSHKSVRVYPKG